MKIDYLGHSGFFVETDSVLLLFDYYCGDLSFIGQKPDEKPLFVFVSHVHEDHYNPKIFSLSDIHPRTTYLPSFDIKGDPGVPKGRNVQYLDADKTYAIEGLGTVMTLLSTDEGIAFLVKTPCATLFHAGDLHWWDWPDEDPEWLDQQETIFKREIGKLEGTPIDVAFAVLDGRLEDNYWKGMEQILSVLRPRYVLPMHFWEDRGIVDRFRELPASRESETIILDTTKETHWRIKLEEE
jgi:L-ascorbate metabolism protein UlaG (beta-lactamase superfamily)